MKFSSLMRRISITRNKTKILKRRLNKCIDNLSSVSIFSPHIKKLHGELEGKYRYEMGVLRIVYEVNIKDKIVEIKSIRSRGDVYKR